MRFVFHIVGIAGGLFLGVSFIALVISIPLEDLAVFGFSLFGVFCGFVLISLAHLGDVAIDIRDALNRRNPPSIPPRNP